jgi:hypothetical protein
MVRIKFFNQAQEAVYCMREKNAEIAVFKRKPEGLSLLIDRMAFQYMEKVPYLSYARSPLGFMQYDTNATAEELRQSLITNIFGAQIIEGDTNVKNA